MWLANMVLPEMAARKDGVIILVSSIAGLRAAGDIGAYGITKAAEFQIARNIASEYGQHNIRANCIAPGLIKTDFSAGLWQDDAIAKQWIDATPLRRLGEPDDIAGAAVFLASQAGAYLTGQAIVIDGGNIITGF
jgi:NAD(P)-dependent dehydrogenase (short-subunit alcohol dehydrogenase family)